MEYRKGARRLAKAGEEEPHVDEAMKQPRAKKRKKSQGQNGPGTATKLQ
jgi:hypothetical protein